MSLAPSVAMRSSLTWALSLLLRWRPARTVMFALRMARYCVALGPRQICWLVEALELEHGHLESRRRQVPMSKDGTPLPWYTYPAIQFLSQLDFANKSGFEFGSGNSSLFWADRLRSLTRIESDPQWHARIATGRRANQEIRLVEDLDEYPESIARSGHKFDLIIVDGKRRRACAEQALHWLANDGVIVLDNSDWHPKTAALLRGAGLIQIDFSGFGPTNNYTWTTSLFLRPTVHLRPLGDRLPQPSIASLVQTVEE